VTRCLILLCLSLASTAWAKDPWVRRARIPVRSLSKPQWKEEYKLLRERIRTSPDLIRSLSISRDHILGVDCFLEDPTDPKPDRDLGIPYPRANGVFLVRTRMGPRVLKLSSLDWPDRTSQDAGYEMRHHDEVAILNHVAEYGLAIPIHEVLDRSQVGSFFDRFPVARAQLRYPDQRVFSGMLMEYLPEAYNPKYPGRDWMIKPGVPPHARTWNRNVLQLSLDDLGKIRDHLQLDVRDGQVLIAKSGLPRLIDVELELLRSRDDVEGRAYRAPDGVTANQNHYTRLFQMIEAELDRLPPP
jgi:hypothetical protein